LFQLKVRHGIVEESEIQLQNKPSVNINQQKLHEVTDWAGLIASVNPDSANLQFVSLLDKFFPPVGTLH